MYKNKTINSKLVVSLFFLLLLSTLWGCSVKFGHDFDPQGFQDWVKPGETTSSEVREKLGTPSSQGMVVEHDSTVLKRYIYYYGKGKLSNMKDAKFKMLEVRFDDNNRVYSFNWSAAVE